MPTAAYIGTTARLLPLEWVQDVRMTQGSRYAVQEAASRSWAFVSHGAGRTPARAWDVTLIGSVATLSNLEALAGGAWGDGPFHWIPEGAYIANSLTPAQSLLTVAEGGPLEVVGGYAPRSALGPTQSTLALGAPVLPGQPATIACDAAGPATLRATFRNAAGGIVSTPTAPATGTSMQRISIHVPITPAEARTVDIAIDGHIAAARPQVTWTREIQPWGPGGGSSQAVVEDLDSTPRHRDGAHGLLYDITARIQEVG